MKVTWLHAGYCLNLEALTLRGAPVRVARYPAGFALLEHPSRGPVLFDTGYHPRFFEATRRFPARAYALATPVVVRPEDTASARLARLGVPPRDVREVIVSHFHADHVAGLRDFPRATLRFDVRAWDAVRDLRGVRAVRAAFLRGLLPHDFDARARPWGPADYTDADAAHRPFERTYDVFGDGSALAVELPGHARGMIGLIVPAAQEFLVADAAWSTRAITEERRPHPVATAVFADRAEERRTFDLVARYARAHPDVRLRPSHCPQALEEPV